MGVQVNEWIPGVTYKSPALSKGVVYLCLLLSLVVHIPALRGDFLYDDITFIVQNHSVQTADLGEIFTHAFPPEDPARGLYRPLTASSYALDWALWGKDPTGFHLTQLLIYFGCLCVMFWCVSFYLGTGWPAVMATLLFSLHPIHCEVVDGLSGRSELLGLTLCLLSLHLFQRAEGRKFPLFVSWFCYVAATLAKETAVVFPAILLAHTLLFQVQNAPDFRSSLRRLLPTLAWFMWVPTYMALRVVVLGRFRPDVVVLADQHGLEKLRTVFAIYREYLRILLWPDLLQFDYWYESLLGHGVPMGWAVMGGVGLLGLLLLLGLSLWRSFTSSHPGWVVVALGLITFFVFAFPTSHIIPFGAVMAERFMFAPSFGAVLAGVAGGLLFWQRVKWSPASYTGVLLVLCLPLAARSHSRAGDWRDLVTLNSELSHLLPLNARVQRNMATGYVGRGDMDEALVYARRALELAPDDELSYGVFGNLLRNKGDLDRAERVFTEASRRWPTSPTAWNQLGVIETQRGQLHRALGYFHNALRVNPNYASAATNFEATFATLKRAQQYKEESCRQAEGAAPEVWRPCEQACRALGDLQCEAHFREKLREPAPGREPTGPFQQEGG